jgi:REP element-mobilizing transposase RayT
MTENQNEKLAIYKRRLPHWRLCGAVYFVTWRLFPGQAELQPGERDLVVSALKHFDGERYGLLAYVVMPNHVHLLVETKNNHRLQDLVHTWKSFTAHRLQRECGRRDRIWQDEYFDRIVRDEEEFLEKAQYILNNPLKVWPDIEEYRWVSVKGLRMAGTEARPTGTEARPTGTEAHPANSKT